MIENGDSPPLKVDAVRARRWPVHLLFGATEPGEYRLYTGNPVCRSPEYDLSIPEPDLRQTPLTAAEFLPPAPNPGHQSTAIWPEGSAHSPDTSKWPIGPAAGRFGIETAGVQRLELDLEVLAHAQPGHADLRLMIDDRQVPYILERRPALHSLKPIVRMANDPDRPRHSRWSLELPFPNLPVTRLTSCRSTTAVFHREMVLFEEPTDQRGGRYRRELGRATWVQAPDRGTPGLLMDLRSTPITDRLTLETDNEDNPPLQLAGVELGYPAVQLLFKSDPGTPRLPGSNGNPSGGCAAIRFEPGGRADRCRGQSPRLPRQRRALAHRVLGRNPADGQWRDRVLECARARGRRPARGHHPAGAQNPAASALTLQAGSVGRDTPKCRPVRTAFIRISSVQIPIPVLAGVNSAPAPLFPLFLAVGDRSAILTSQRQPAAPCRFSVPGGTRNR